MEEIKPVEIINQEEKRKCDFCLQHRQLVLIYVSKSISMESCGECSEKLKNKEIKDNLFPFFLKNHENKQNTTD